MRPLLDFIRGTLGMLHSLCILLLLASAAAVLIPPSLFWPVSFGGLFFFPLYILNLSIIPIWFWRKKWFALLPLSAALLTAPLLPRSIQWPGKAQEKGTVKLLSWNVKLFDLYSWSGEKNTPSEMFALIKKENPDILCLQEVFNRNGRENNIQFIRDSLGYPYSCFYPAMRKTHRKRDKIYTAEYGVAIFSRFPITHSGYFSLENRLISNCSYADVLVKGKTIRVFNAHLQSVHLDDLDYAHLEDLQQRQHMTWLQAGKILRKLKRAWGYREKQARQMEEAIAAWPGPVILCCDLNDVPVSFSYQLLSKKLQDAHISAGNGLGATLFGKFFLFRIDYTFFSPSFSIRSSRTVRRQLSDHYPLVVTFDTP
jgi:endonuclease/exonuclease/phosphatase family metal-dependent hydrolase